MLMSQTESAHAAQAADVRRLPSPDRTPSVTPLDVRQAKFATAMRGFDRAEVAAFLLEAADGYEQALRDNERLRQEIARLDASLTQYRELEGTLKSALIGAQKLADDVRENATQEANRLREHAAQEAARIVRDAEGRVELLMEQSQARIEDVQREIDGLKLKRREAETGLESIVAALQSTLEFVREQGDRDARPAVHRTRLDVAQPA
jgi:cell division initiation protein